MKNIPENQNQENYSAEVQEDLSWVKLRFTSNNSNNKANPSDFLNLPSSLEKLTCAR